MNELAMVLHVTKGDPRPAFVQGVEDVSVDQVIGIRDCIITSKPYPMMSFRDAGYPHLSILSGLTPEEHKQILFEQGRLVCRCVHISIVEASGKAYDGEVRNIYARESDSSTLSSSSEGSICIDSDNDDDVVVIGTKNRKSRSESAQGKKLKPSQRQTRLPAKTAKYTFGDAFCGVGGASQGAVQAGLHVLWGLDKDHAAIEAYNRNHASAQIFLLDAHDFPPPDMVKSLRVDILHLSPPCCYWSPAQ
jgi:DNA (cytosine-5)-methyltransferase 1